MANMALHRLLGEEQPVADLAVHESLGDELKHLDLTRRGRMFRLWCDARRELDELRNRRPSGRYRLKSTGMRPVTGQDLLTLCCVHVGFIGRA